MAASFFRIASLVGPCLVHSASGTPMPTYDSGTPGPTYDIGTPGPTNDVGTPAPTYDMGGTPSPTIDSSYHCKAYGHADGCVTYQQHADMGCQKHLTVQECVGLATSMEVEITFETNADIQYGCVVQQIDNVVIWNDANNDEYAYAWCGTFGGNCIVTSVCNTEVWDTRFDGDACPLHHDLSEDECYEASQNNAMFYQARSWQTTAHATLPHGCYGDKMNKWVTYNVNPLGFWDGVAPDYYLPLCARVANSGPTPMPTPMTATPAPTQKVMEFFVRNQHGICLDAKRRRDRGGTVHMWDCQQTGEQHEWNKNQHWNLVVDSEDAEIVQGKVKSHDGICLDSSEAMNGGKVWMWPCSKSNKRQQWSYNKQTGQLMNANGYCLDARQRMTTGGKVHMWTCMTGNKNQRWALLQHPSGLDYYGSKMDYSQNILQTGTWMGDYMPNMMP